MIGEINFPTLITQKVFKSSQRRKFDKTNRTLIKIKYYLYYISFFYIIEDNKPPLMILY